MRPPTHTHPADYGRPQISTQADPRRQSLSRQRLPIRCTVLKSPGISRLTAEIPRGVRILVRPTPVLAGTSSTFGLDSVCHGQSVITSQLRPSDSLSVCLPEGQTAMVETSDLPTSSGRSSTSPAAVTSWVAVSGGGSAPVSRDRQRSLPSEATSLALDLSFSPGGERTKGF